MAGGSSVAEGPPRRDPPEGRRMLGYIQAGMLKQVPPTEAETRRQHIWHGDPPTRQAVGILLPPPSHGGAGWQEADRPSAQSFLHRDLLHFSLETTSRVLVRGRQNSRRCRQAVAGQVAEVQPSFPEVAFSPPPSSFLLPSSPRQEQEYRCCLLQVTGREI